MTDKTRVRIRIESRSGSETNVQKARGDLYRKGDHTYIRYEEEPNELGRTVTLIKLEENQIRIVRQGDVQAEQTFVPGEKRIGFYHTPQGRLELEVDTHELKSEAVHGIGITRWKYDLYASGTHAGTYRIKLLIQEE
ncbi:DUF1934 domain-containing protein [Paenibacillus sp. GCM10023248]|uniref:DUF1934 domain-containing protein n=1 Tax=Bacillales TaxID=1385 RepID=UPI0023783A2C|nr:MULTISPECIES: DUF1934 domain-containing protein [Bacillales]MDD9270561.1 DUF1934 domain-containing protein [Paenibacillus sp. MAHUQ-63]MDR6885470.1 uncharacterized beta-barrel protein YwiB (DUF1934 family) [Bacillus sp. 3255]